MMRNALNVIAGLILLMLVLSLGYAMLGLGGPEARFADAQRAAQRGEWIQAIRLLEMAEDSRGVGKVEGLRRQILELRYRAWRETDNPRRALEDLGRLLDQRLAPELQQQLQLEQVQLLLQLGSTGRAERLARELTETQGDNPAAWELSGQVAQTIYQEDLRELLITLDRDLASADMLAARRELNIWLYGPADDPAVAASRVRLRALLAGTIALGPDTYDLPERVEFLRQQVQRSLECYQAALARAGREPMVSAFRSVVRGLRSAGRDDDVLIQCEIQLQRTKRPGNPYWIEALTRLLRQHREAGRLTAARSCLDRWLTTEEIEGLFGLQMLGTAGVETALEIVRLWREETPRDPRLVQRGLRLLAALRRHDLNRSPLSSLAQGLILEGSNNADRLEAAINTLGGFLRAAGNNPAPIEGEDLVAFAYQRRLELLLEADYPDEELDDLVSSWAKARPADATPFVLRAEHNLNRGLVREAWLDAERAMATGAQDETMLQRLQPIAASFFQGSGQDGAGLLATAQRQDSADVPVPHPICWLLLAKAALLAEQPTLALGAARQAVSAWLWARQPRILQARAALAAGRPADAVDVLRSLGGQEALDREGLELLAAAREAQGQVDPELRLALLRAGSSGADTRYDLLRSAAEEGGDPADLMEILRPMVDAPEPAATRDDPRLLSAGVRVALQLGDRAAATTWLQRLRELDAPDLAPALVDAITAGIGGSPAALIAELEQVAADRPELFWTGLHLLALRASNSERKDVLTAMDRWLRTGPHADLRDGSHYLLAARLAATSGDRDRIPGLLTAAVSFPDGAAAAGPLALLELQADRAERARMIARAIPDTWDNPCGRELLGIRRDDATPAAAPRLHERILGLVGGEAATPEDWGGLADAVADPVAQDSLLLAAAWLAEPGFNALALAPLQQVRVSVGPSPGLRILELAARRGNTASPQQALQQLAGLSPQGLGSTFAADRLRLATGWYLDIAKPERHRPEFRAAAEERAFLLPAEWPVALLPEAFFEEPAFRQGLLLPGPRTAPLRWAFALTAAAGARQNNNSAKAVELALPAWLESPAATGAGPEEVASLVAAGLNAEALQLAGLLLVDAPPDTRLEICAVAFPPVLALPKDDPRRAAAVALAQRLLDGQATPGAAYDLLIQDDIDRFGPLPGPGQMQRSDPDRVVRVQAWVDAHLQLCQTGADPRPAAATRSLEWLAALAGTTAALERSTALLQARPWLADVWSLRARMLAGQGDHEAAVKELTAAAELFPSTPRRAARLRLLAMQGRLPENAAEEVQQLSRLAAREPSAALAVGYASLRLGRYGDARKRLANAEPLDPAGWHLLSAVADLGVGDEAALRSAATHLRTLVQEFPNSSWSGNAGSFAAQLATLRDTPAPSGR